MNGRLWREKPLKIGASLGAAIFILSLMPAGPAWSDDGKPTVEPYGYVELDTVYSSRDTNPLDPAQFNGYATAAGKDNHSSSTFNPRFSVLGIRATQNVGDDKLMAKVEGDFYGQGQGNPEPRLRLAYIDWTHGDNRLTVGQDWLSVAQLLPSALDFSIMGYGGDLWQRIPQVSYRRKLDANWEGL